MNSINSSFMSLYTRGLGRSLFIILLCSALLPMILVSLLYFQDTKEVLLDSSSRHLNEVISSQAAKINGYFSRMKNNLSMLSDMRQNTLFLQKLKHSYKRSQLQLNDFIRSYKWAELSEQGADLVLFRRAYGVHDIFIMDNQGNILFSVARESDLGTNLFSDQTHQSSLALACRTTQQSGKLSFGDYQYYTVRNGNHAYAFLCAAMVDENGERIGLMAFQLAANDLDAMMDTSLGQWGEAYLMVS